MKRSDKVALFRALHRLKQAQEELRNVELHPGPINLNRLARMIEKIEDMIEESR